MRRWLGFVVVSLSISVALGGCGTERNAEVDNEAKADEANRTGESDASVDLEEQHDEGNADAGVDVAVPVFSCVRVESGPDVVLTRTPTGQTRGHAVTIANCSADVALEISAIRICTMVHGQCDSSSPILALDAATLPVGLPDGLAVLDVGATHTFEIAVTPDADGPILGELTVEANTSDGSDIFEIVGSADSSCPTAVGEGRPEDSSRWLTDILTVPLKTIQLNGAKSSSEVSTVAEYAWTVVDRPAGSTSQLMPSADVAEPTLFLDVPGDYRVELRVSDADGFESCETAPVTIVAWEGDDIMVELIWDTPTDPDQTDQNGNDVDLHFLHSSGTWNTLPFDIFWGNASPDWGAEGVPDDDPSLDIDDTDGAGPEIITLAVPEDGVTYSVGAYYYADNGFGAAYATVRVYVRGQLEVDWRDMYLPARNTFWYVATLSWPSEEALYVNQVQTGFPNRP